MKTGTKVKVIGHGFVSTIESVFVDAKGVKTAILESGGVVPIVKLEKVK